MHVLTNEAAQRGIVDPTKKAEFFGLIGDIVQGGLFPHLSDSATQLAAQLTNCRREIALDERQSLYQDLLRYSRGLELGVA
jgi:hypothetical protein